MRRLERSDRRRVVWAAAERQTKQSSGTLRSRAAAHVVKRQMEQSNGRRPLFQRREGSIMVMTVDKEGEDTTSEWEEVVCRE